MALFQVKVGSGWKDLELPFKDLAALADNFNQGQDQGWMGELFDNYMGGNKQGHILNDATISEYRENDIIRAELEYEDGTGEHLGVRVLSLVIMPA